MNAPLRSRTRPPSSGWNERMSAADGQPSPPQVPSQTSNATDGDDD